LIAYYPVYSCIPSPILDAGALYHSYKSVQEKPTRKAEKKFYTGIVENCGKGEFLTGVNN
jgi:hypothetical protein